MTNIFISWNLLVRGQELESLTLKSTFVLVSCCITTFGLKKNEFQVLRDFLSRVNRDYF